MSPLQRRVLLLGLATLLPACHVRAPYVAPLPTDAGLSAHVRAAKRAGADPSARDDATEPSLDALQAEWAATVSTPSALSLVRRFETEPLLSLRAQAREDGLGGLLAEGATEDLFVAAAYERSPALRAARQDLRAAVRQFSQVTQMDAILSVYASFQRDSRAAIGMPLPEDRAARHFPQPGTQALKGAVIAATIGEQTARYRDAVRNTVRTARVLHARLVQTDKVDALLVVMQDVMRQVEASASAKIESNTGRKGAVLKAQVERAKIEDERLTVQQRRTVLQADVLRLLDLPLTALPEGRALHVVEPPLPQAPAALETLTVRAEAHEPSLAIVDAKLRRMEAMIEVAERQAIPAWSAGLSEMESPSPATAGTGRVRDAFPSRPRLRPDPWFGAKDAYLQEARERLEAARSRREGKVRAAHFAVHDAREALATGLRRHTLDREVLLPRAQESFEDAMAGYAAERGSMLDVLESVRAWLRTQRAADATVRDVHIADAKLEAAVAAPRDS